MHIQLYASFPHKARDSRCPVRQIRRQVDRLYVTFDVYF